MTDTQLQNNSTDNNEINTNTINKTTSSSIQITENIKKLQESIKLSSSTTANNNNNDKEQQLVQLLNDLSSHIQKRVTNVSKSIKQVDIKIATLTSSVQNTFNDISIQRHKEKLITIATVQNNINNDCSVNDDNKNEEIISNSNINDLVELDRTIIEDKAISNGLESLSIFLDPATANNETCYYYKTNINDEFNHVPLPYIIGSRPFLQSYFAGLAPDITHKHYNANVTTAINTATNKSDYDDNDSDMIVNDSINISTSDSVSRIINDESSTIDNDHYMQQQQRSNINTTTPTSAKPRLSQLYADLQPPEFFDRMENNDNDNDDNDSHLNNDGYDAESLDFKQY